MVQPVLKTHNVHGYWGSTAVKIVHVTVSLDIGITMGNASKEKDSMKVARHQRNATSQMISMPWFVQMDYVSVTKVTTKEETSIADQ